MEQGGKDKCSGGNRLGPWLQLPAEKTDGICRYQKFRGREHVRLSRCWEVGQSRF